MKRYFTLIELLVVITIIIILAALLLPTLNKARGKAKSNNCQVKLKQIAVGGQLYADDFQDWATPAAGTHWMYESKSAWSWSIGNIPHVFPGNILRYLGIDDRGMTYNQLRAYKIFHCPSFDSTLTTGGSMNYGVNCYLGGISGLWDGTETNPGVLYKLSSIRHPGQTVFYTETHSNSPWSSGTMSDSIGYYEVLRRHSGLANAAWADGHVTASQKPKFWLYWYEVAGVRINTFENAPLWNPRRIK